VTCEEWVPAKLRIVKRVHSPGKHPDVCSPEVQEKAGWKPAGADLDNGPAIVLTSTAIDINRG
jgi:hypothetical protein